MHTTRREKVDLHLHSHASNVTDYFAANAFSIPESYTDPLWVYRELKTRGMSLVTLTDHNSIDGVLEILDAGHWDVFISSELTTTFPEDQCNIHITVANVTEAQFAEANRLRGNIYELVAYLDQQIAGEAAPGAAGNRIAYFMTHPLMSTQNRPYGREGALSVAHLEKALLLCNCIEVHNGSRTRALNLLTAQMLATLDQPMMERLADQHGIAPKGDTPWIKSVVGGSDDHSGINHGRTWTEFAGDGTPPTANLLIDSIRAKATSVTGQHGGPITIAHSILKLMHDAPGGEPRDPARQAGSTISISRSVRPLLGLAFAQTPSGIFDRVLLQTRIFGHQLRQQFPQVAQLLGQSDQRFEEILEAEVFALLANAGFAESLRKLPSADERIFLVIKLLIYRLCNRYIERIESVYKNDLVSAIKESVALVSSNVLVSLPYIAAFLQQSADAQIARDVRRAFGITESPRVALLTDTFFEVNGVSASIKRMIREAQRRGYKFTVVVCVAPGEHTAGAEDPEVRAWIESGHLRLFNAVRSFNFPQYEGLRVHLPPVLDILKFLQEGGFTKVQLSTPGTMGLCGLFAAKMLQIDSAATYHTSIPEYVENYTRDVSLEAMAWRYMVLFYHAVDETIVPSRFVARLLHKRGLRKRRLLILDRWVDVQRFAPANRVSNFWDRFKLDATTSANCVKFIYVGRLAVEKNLHLLAHAFRDLVRELRHAEADNSAQLILVGDGPYRSELARLLDGLPVTWTGYLHGTELATAIASADVKVFPSTTDTWGNAPLEAQASGLPVIVSDIGGPIELMEDGVTGIAVRGNDSVSLLHAMHRLMEPSVRAKMGQNARAFAVANRVDEPFTAILDSDALRRRQKQTKKERVTRPTPHVPPSVRASGTTATILPLPIPSHPTHPTHAPRLTPPSVLPGDDVRLADYLTA